MQVFLFSSGIASDVAFMRPTVRRVLDRGHADVMLGACRDHLPLLGDFVQRGVPVRTLDANSGPHGALIDLGCLAPEGALPIDLSFRQYDDTRGYDWSDSVEILDRKLAEVGIDPWLTYDEHDVPMLDFDLEVDIPRPTRPTIYVDGCYEGDRFGYFSFDVLRLARTFDGFDFACTRPPTVAVPNVLDMSPLGPVERSKFSERCELLLGMTRYPFGLTLTEANRHKPKAMCGHDPRTVGPFWDYPENPLELLPTMDAVVDFVGASLVGCAS